MVPASTPPVPSLVSAVTGAGIMREPRSTRFVSLGRPLSRRDVLRQAAVAGASASSAGAILARRAGAQATPAAAAPTGDPIRIGASVSTTGSNGRTGLYQQEA